MYINNLIDVVGAVYFVLMNLKIVKKLWLASVIFLASLSIDGVVNGADPLDSRLGKTIGYMYHYEAPGVNIREQSNKKNIPRIFQRKQDTLTHNPYGIQLSDQKDLKRGYKKNIRSRATHFYEKPKIEPKNQIKNYISKSTQNHQQQNSYNKNTFLRPNIRRRQQRHRKSVNYDPVGAANVVSKTTAIAKYFPNSNSKNTSKQPTIPEKWKSHFNDDEEIILQNELEMKIQEVNDDQKRFQYIQQSLENNGYKELQKLRQERNALRYVVALNEKKVHEVENKESLINDVKQTLSDKKRIQGQKWTNRYSFKK